VDGRRANGLVTGVTHVGEGTTRVATMDYRDCGRNNARRKMEIARRTTHVARCHIDISILVFTSNYKIQVLTSSTITTHCG
jgi:hypothetical protein